MSLLQHGFCKFFGISVGLRGEWLALGYLRRKGWDILARNWRSRRGELDLVAYDQEELVALEVKTRTRSPFPLPENQIDAFKQAQLERTFNEFRLRYELNSHACRYDLIAIELLEQRRYELRHYLAFI